MRTLTELNQQVLLRVDPTGQFQIVFRWSPQTWLTQDCWSGWNLADLRSVLCTLHAMVMGLVAEVAKCLSERVTVVHLA